MKRVNDRLKKLKESGAVAATENLSRVEKELAKLLSEEKALSGRFKELEQLRKEEAALHETVRSYVGIFPEGVNLSQALNSEV